MSDLTEKHCEPCEGGIAAMDTNRANEQLQKLDQWEIDVNSKKISKQFSFKNFHRTMSFVNAVAWVANQENHHPDIELGYNYCNISLTTHAIDGLSVNDFIVAAKIDVIEKL